MGPTALCLTLSGPGRFWQVVKGYEVITILKNADATVVEQGKKAVKDILVRNEGKIAKEDDWGTRKLHHPIAHSESGHFLYHEVQLDPAKVVDVRRDLKIDQNVLRYLVKRTA